MVTVLLSSIWLLLGCLKEGGFLREMNPPNENVRTATYAIDGVDSVRLALAQAIIKGLNNEGFVAGVSQGLSLRCNGENEVLFAEMISAEQPTRGESWNEEVRNHLTQELFPSDGTTRGGENEMEEQINRILDIDPMLDVHAADTGIYQLEDVLRIVFKVNE